MRVFALLLATVVLACDDGVVTGRTVDAGGMVAQAPSPAHDAGRPDAGALVAEEPLPALPALLAGAVPAGPLQPVYAVYVDVEELARPADMPRDRWLQRDATRPILSYHEARRRHLTARYQRVLQKHQERCKKAGYGVDPNCDADRVACAQDFLLPTGVQLEKRSAENAVALIERDAGSGDIRAFIVRDGDAWKIDRIECPP